MFVFSLRREEVGYTVTSDADRLNGILDAFYVKFIK